MINLLLMPESFTSGMAGSKRVGNFLSYLFETNSFKITNVILFSGSVQSQSSEFSFVKQINLVYSNPFFRTIKVIKSLIQLHEKGCKNILYYYGYPDILNIIFLFKAKKLGYKIVFDIVENNFLIGRFNSIKTRIRTYTSKILFKYLNSLASGIICISSQLNEFIIYSLGNTVPIILLPVTIIKEKFPQIQVPFKFNLPIRLFYGGSFGEKDGLIFLLQAFDIVANQYNVELHLSGKGNIKDERFIRDYISGLTHKDKIYITGFLNEEDYYNLLNNADIHCMTRNGSKYANSGFPFKLGEMLATGRPVIATKVGDVEKYVNNDEALLIEAESVNAISNAMIRLITDPGFANKIGSAGRNCALRNFEAGVHSARLNKFLNEI